MRKSHCQREGGGFGLQKETQACGSGWNRVMMCFLLDKALHVGRTNEVAGKTSRTAQSCEHGETKRLNFTMLSKTDSWISNESKHILGSLPYFVVNTHTGWQLLLLLSSLDQLVCGFAILNCGVVFDWLRLWSTFDSFSTLGSKTFITEWKQAGCRVKVCS